MLNKIKNQLLITVILATMLAVFVGCSEPAEKMVEDSETEIISEELVEVTTNSEVSEPVSEEPSEVVSEEVSEEVPKIVDGIQMVYYETYEDFLTFFESIQEPIIAVFHFTEHVEDGQAILYDGAHYTLSENFVVTVKTPKVISSMDTSAEYVYISDYDSKDGIHEWDITLETTGTDIEVPLTITYEDGTTDAITVYFTKDWKYSWEN